MSRNLPGSPTRQGCGHPLQAIRRQIAAWPLAEKMCVAALAFFVLLYIFYFSAYQIQRQHAYDTSLDTLSVEQPIWNTLHGFFMRATYYPVTGNTVTDFNDRTTNILFGDHVQPSLLALLIPYAILPRTETLLVILCICESLGAIPTYRIARRRLGSPWLALLFAMGYLLIPTIETNTGWDIHGASFLPPLLLASLDAAETGHSKIWWIFAMLAMGFREDFPIFVGWAMVWLVPRNLRKQALVMFAVGLVLSSLSFLVVIPFFGGKGTPYLVRFFPTGTPMTPEGIWSVVSQASFLRDELIRLVVYNMRLGFPLLLLYFTSFPALLAIAPLMIANSFSWYLIIPDYFHYSSPLIPWVIVGAIDGFNKVTSFLRKRYPHFNWSGVLSAALSTSILTTHVMMGYSPLSMGYVWPDLTGRENIAQEMIDQIPHDDAVSVEQHLSAHFTHFKTVHLFPDVRDAQWILLDMWYGSYSLYQSLDSAQILWDAIQRDASWETVAARDGLILLKKGSGPPQNLGDAYRISNPSQPQFIVHFGGQKGLELVNISLVHQSRSDITLCTDWDLADPSIEIFPRQQFLSYQNKLSDPPTSGFRLNAHLFIHPGRYRICNSRILPGYYGTQRYLQIALENGKEANLDPVSIINPGKWAPYLKVLNNGLEIDLSGIH
jgi:uncharacterized membrane protein